MDVQGKSIFVGLSGGVDSAVAAALLLRAGARVTGVFVKGWYPPGLPCTWKEDRRDAMRVAAHLGIPFRTLDASAAYKEHVIDYLLAEYRAGRTPNPDIFCNREVKFGVLYRYARKEGTDTIATGHYRSGDKDQRYFLWAIPKEVYDSVLFPLDGMPKEKVRALARALRLPVAEKPDSQGICFLGPVSVEEFLHSEFGSSRGDAVTENGEVVGTHEGALLATIGERVALDGQNGPWYVLSKDVAMNTLVVGHERATALPSRAISFAAANWFAAPETVTSAQLRYRGARVWGAIGDGTFIPSGPALDPSVPGQSIVFYDARGELVGGAIQQS